MELLLISVHELLQAPGLCRQTTMVRLLVAKVEADYAWPVEEQGHTLQYLGAQVLLGDPGARNFALVALGRVLVR